MEEHYVQLDLFGEEVRTKQLSEWKTTNKNMKPSVSSDQDAVPAAPNTGFVSPPPQVHDTYAAIVQHCMAAGLQSAREIAECLVDQLRQQGHEAERYSTGKPHLYVPLCQYLDRQVVEGALVYLGGNEQDRRYIAHVDEGGSIEENS